MSKQQALLQTLLGAAELVGNDNTADRIRLQLLLVNRVRQTRGYQRLWSVALESRFPRRKVA
jgi:hypothetical protein